MKDKEYLEAKEDSLKYEQYIEKHLPIVRGIASSYSRYGDYSDLCQEGSIGLLIAFQKFDYTKGVPFKHYCRYWIRNRIQDFLWKKSTMKVTREQFLNGAVPKNVGEVSLKFIECDQRSPLDRVHTTSMQEDVALVLQELPERDRKIIKMYFGIDSDSMSYQKIGEVLGYSKQRIQQLIVKILETLKGKLEKWKS